jgi:hypothetical protein
MFEVATDIGLTTKEYLWIVTKSVVAVTADLENSNDDQCQDVGDIPEYKMQQTHYPLGLLGKLWQGRPRILRIPTLE